MKALADLIAVGCLVGLTIAAFRWTAAFVRMVRGDELERAERRKRFDEEDGRHIAEAIRERARRDRRWKA